MSHQQGQNERIAEIFEQAASLALEERAGFLDGRLDPSHEPDCAIRREVERLLAHCDDTGILDKSLISSGNPASRVEPPSSALEPGELISGRYRIGRMIGSGGMGEVYEAEELATGQTVALKTIRADMAADAEQAARFTRELLICRTLAHRNVCKVFEYDDVDRGEKGRLRFFTMELLRGETLAQRLSVQRRLDPECALAILEQVAAGLEEVHRSGTIHRDLKPSNIFLVRQADGSERVVVMDFGLARNLTEADLRQTRTGMVMGTRLYMAPESAKQVGVASDIYSFGVVALEMVTGAPSPIMAPRSAVPALDPAWDKALLACLDLDPAKRPASALEVVAILRRGTRSWRKIAIASAAAAVCAGGLAAWSWLGRADVSAPSATQITFDSGVTVDPSSTGDGKLLAYASDRNSSGDLNVWVQNVETGETRQITNDPGDDDQPTLSPDGKLIVWRSVREDTLYVRALEGGTPRALVKSAFAPRFSPDGRYIAYWNGVDGERSAPARTFVVPVAGGEPREIAPGFADARLPSWPQDGKSIVVRGVRTAATSLEDAQDWWMVPLDGGPPRATGIGPRLRKAGLQVHESPTLWNGSTAIFSARAGHGTNLWSVGLSSFNGSPRPITSGAGYQDAPAMLSGGRIAFSDWREQIHLFRIDSVSGALEQVTNHQSLDTRVSSSSDGRVLVFGRRLGLVRNIWTKDLGTGVERELATNELAVPFVSPDGRTVAISAGVTIRSMDVESARQTERCSDCGELRGWMPGGTEVLYLENGEGKPRAVRTLNLENGSRRTLISAPGVDEAAVSPDGGRIAFTIRSGGTHSAIFVANLDASGAAGQRLQVTPADNWADKPLWSADGNVLYFSAHLDGFQCIWKRALRPVLGEPEAVHHFHAAAATLAHLSPASFGLAIGGGSLYLSVSLTQSNIWAIRQ